MAGPIVEQSKSVVLVGVDARHGCARKRVNAPSQGTRCCIFLLGCQTSPGAVARGTGSRMRPGRSDPFRNPGADNRVYERREKRVDVVS